MASEIGAAGLAADQMGQQTMQLVMRMLEGSGRTDWSRLATALGGQGERLDEVVRRRMEYLLGHDLGEARLHSGTQVERLAGYLGAEAFTIGRHVFAPAASIAGTAERGESILAHELTHVVQQTRPHQLAAAATPLAGPAIGVPAPQESLAPQLAARDGSVPVAAGAAEAEAQAVEQAVRRGTGQPAGQRQPIDFEALAERVYALLREDLLIERERLGPAR